MRVEMRPLESIRPYEDNPRLNDAVYPAADLRCANRNWVRPSYRNYNVGFRVARTLVVETELREVNPGDG
jgi:hypothetical protein